MCQVGLGVVLGPLHLGHCDKVITFTEAFSKGSVPASTLKTC